MSRPVQNGLYCSSEKICAFNIVQYGCNVSGSSCSKSSSSSSFLLDEAILVTLVLLVAT